MMRSRKFWGLIAALVLATVARAMPERKFAAAQLAQGGAKVIQDFAPVYLPPDHNGKRVFRAFPAVAMPKGGAPLKLDLGELPVGLYYVDVVARWDRETPADQRATTAPYRGGKEKLALSGLDQVRAPVYLHVKVNDGPGGAANDYRMLALYNDYYAQVTRVYFHVNEPRRITAEVRVAEDSHEGLRVKEISFHDSLEGITRTRAKQKPALWTPESRERARQEAMKANPRLKLSTAAPMPADARRQRDDVIWNAMPRLNSLVYAPHGGERANYIVPGASAASGGVTADQANALKDDPRFKDLGVWDLEGVDPKDYHGNAWAKVVFPLNFVHHPGDEKYTMQQLYNHEPLPNRPFRETPTGAFFPAADVPAVGRNHYVFTIGNLVWRRYMQFWRAIITSESETFGLKLREKYELTADVNVARDASLMLVRMAYQWPALDLMWQDLGQLAANPNLDYFIDTRGGWKSGKLYYRGWSGGTWVELMESYDALFDFIDGNQELADAVHRYLPWVKTPDDVVALLDTYLVRVGVRECEENRISGNFSVSATAAMILGGGPDVAQIMDISKSTTNIYPFRDGPVLDMVSCGYSRDGIHYIGSTSYGAGGAESLVRMAQAFLALKETGSEFKLDLSDVKRYPKIAAAAESLLNLNLAGGYYLAVGDASGNIWAGRQHIDIPNDLTETCWRLTGDPRFAWLLVNEAGRGGRADEDWKQLTDAAAGVRDPRLHQRSRVMGGFGAAILESGEEFNDFRLKEAVVLRTGTGQGHVHNDALDLNYFALGCRMSTDTATRSEGQLWSEPPSRVSMVHNTVEVDGKMHPWNAGDGWPGGAFSASDAWVEAFKPIPGAQFTMGAAVSNAHKDVQLFRREVAHIRVADGREGTPPPADKLGRGAMPKDAVLPQSYIFDVFRVDGGRWHTWCFHGCASDEFTVNVPLHELGDAAKDNEEDKWSRVYTRKLNQPAAGKAGDVVEAVWRLRRDKQVFDTPKGAVTANAAEPAMLGASYDPTAPRRFTRVSLFGHPGAVVLRGSPYSAPYNYHFPFLYVQERSEEKGRQNVFPAIIEAYQDQPAVTEKTLLEIAGNETDALRAVAVAVKTANGHSDICFAGGRPEKVRTLPGGEKMSGLFAFVSRDAGGLRHAALVGGSTLEAGDLLIRVAKPKHEGRITAVDYRKLQCALDIPLPANAAGGELFISNADHRTHYTIASVENVDGKALVTFTRTADQGRAPVTTFKGMEITLPYGPFNSHEYANRDKGWTVTNESHTKFWKVARTWKDTYTLSRAMIAADLDDADGDGRKCVEFYDYGVGDSVEMPAHVSVRRTADGYEVTGDEAEVTVAGKKLDMGLK